MSEHSLTYEIIGFVASIIGYIGVAFIVIGSTLATYKYILSLFGSKYTTDHVRLTLGTYILIGLEFMVGEDIINTVLHTSFDNLIELGMIVVIRTALDFFLSREMTHLEHHIREKHLE